MEAIELLRSKLVGEFISNFNVGDTWGLYFGRYWIITQDIISDDEGLLNRWLQSNYSLFNSAVDKENISKCALIATCMRREVVDVRLDKLCNLEIEFEDSAKLIMPSNVEVVDWQWCLNETNKDPYSDYIVACFWEGEIRVDETRIS